MANFLKEYDKYFTSRQFTRLNLFELLNKKYKIKKALYLGSHIHITPSLVFAEVVYVDSYEKFKQMVESEEARQFVKKFKNYSGQSSYTFIKQNYENKIEIDDDFDLLISQYAGFVSQAGKKYLRKGGILVANNSHGDATMAQLDSDFKLISVANHTKDKWHISNEKLDGYFVRKDGEEDLVETLRTAGKGPAYSKNAANYIFRKV